MNGIRNGLSNQDSIFSRVELEASIATIQTVFGLFVTIVGAIALFISFFLLLIAMTQNIEEAIWEYGVLRSIGLSSDEGRRLYLYEAFTVVGAASLLGITIGFLVSLLLANQLYTFIELPMTLYFPYFTLTFMLVMATATTCIAVYLPVKKVNKK